MGFFGGKKKRTRRSRAGTQGRSGARSGGQGGAGAGLSQFEKEQHQVIVLGESFKASQITFSELVTRLGAFYEFTGNALDDEQPLMDQGFDEIAVAETVNSLQDIFQIQFEVEDEELYTLSVNDFRKLFKQ